MVTRGAEDARTGEFRVQAEYGGRVALDHPPASVIAAASVALGCCPVPPLYARVDGIETDRGFVLMELEVIEPELFLSVSPAAAGRLARALVHGQAGTAEDRPVSWPLELDDAPPVVDDAGRCRSEAQGCRST